MSNHIPSNDHGYTHFDNMSTEELEEILRLDSQLPDDEENDIDAILYILEVIERREKENPTGRLSDVHSAWASFEKNYLPYVGDSKSLYDFNDTVETEDLTKTPFEKLPRSQRTLRMYRVAFVAAILIVIVFAGTITASAFGFDLWGIVAKWTKDTFGFSYSETDGTERADLEEALENHGITDSFVPKWFPDGYSLENISVTETPLKTTFTARYVRFEDELIVTIVSLSEPITKTYEKDGEDVKVITVNGIEHFAMTNLGISYVIWQQAYFECSITGSFSLEEAENMINSIYER